MSVRAAAPLLLCVVASALGPVLAKRAAQAQRSVAVEASGEAVVQKDCVDNGRMYHLQEQFERSYHGRALRCTCLGGQALDCEPVQQASGEQMCFDQYTGRRYPVGETWERPRKGVVWDCTCLGMGAGRISCSTENRCHDQGQSYRLGERWKRPHSTDGQMLECVCLGNGKGEWTCNPMAGVAERCYDNVLGSWFAVGDNWERPYQTWMMVDCTCVGGGLGHVSCSSKNRCNDQDSQSSYRVGETWTKTDAAGDLLRCVCTGNGRGEWKCEVHSTTVSATNAGAFVGVEAQFRQTAQCELDNGATYSTGQQWLKMQGTDRMLCTCLGNGVSCQTSGVMTYGGNAPGDPCVFPFVYTGLSYTACVGEGRSDGKLWCSTTGNYDQDRKYTFCRSESALIQTRGGNSNGALCHFPFYYNQRSYTECTAEGRPDSMQWCSTTEHYDEDRKFGFCPMEAHEEVCSSQGAQYRVGDQWDKRHQMGHMMRCTCNGNGRGEWNCIPYAQLLDRCVVDEVEYNVNQTFSRKHAEGHMMNCTCYGQGRGRWACDPVDQCQDLEMMQFYQIGETWNKLYKGTAYICGCYGNSVGEWNCRPQTTEIATSNPVQVTISEDNKNRHSQQLQWTNTQGRPVNWYFLKWRPKGSVAAWKEARVPPQRNTYKITGLRPGLVYEGQLITHFSHGATAISKFEFSTASVPLPPWEGERERLPGTEQHVSDAITEVTSNSFVIAWASAGQVMSGYRVEYELTEDSSSREIINLPGSATSITLDSLLPGREYTVTVIELGARGIERIILTTTQTTAPDAPENYSIDEVTESTIIIRWRLPSAQVTAFRIIYLPDVEGGESTDLHLPPDVTRTRLVDLLPGHTYNISVFSVADDLESPPLFMQVATRGSERPEQRLLPPSDLTFVTVGETKVMLMWSPPPSAEEVRGYRVVAAAAAPGQGRVPPIELPLTTNPYADLSGLLPGRAYLFQVFAVYAGGESPPLRGEQSTKLDAPREVRFVEVGETSVTAAWRPPRGPVTGYLVRCEPTDGGEPLQHTLDTDVTSFTLDGLRAGTEYVLTVYAVSGDEQSPGVSGIVSTQSVREMSEFVIEVTESTIVVSWNSVPRLSIQVRVAPVEGGGDAREFESDSGRLFIEDLTPGVDYTVTIRVLVDGQPRGQPIQRHVTTALPPPTEIKVETNGNPGELQVSWESSEVQAITAYRVTCVADGRGGSRQVLQEVVSPQHNHTMFEHLLPGVQYNVSVYAVGMDAESLPASAVVVPEIPPPKGLQFSDASDTSITMQWQHPNLANVAGYRLTVAAPSSSSDHAGSPHHDAGRPNAYGPRQQPGGGAAGGEPLLSLELGPDAERYTVDGLEPGIDYHFSLATVTEQGQSLPATQWHSTAVPSPTNLRFSHVREDGFRVTWSPPGTLTAPTKYLVRHGPSGGADRTETDIPASSNTAILTGLHPGTEYHVSVHTYLEGQESAALSGTQHTAPDAATGLQFSSVTASSLTVTWRAPLAAVEGYRVRFGREGQAEPREEWVPAPATSVALEGLAGGELYTVAVYALSSSRLESRPLTGRQATAVDSPTDLRVVSQSATSFLVTWTPPTTYVSNYVVSYHYGRHPAKEVTVPGRDSSVLIENLQPGAEYSVSLRVPSERGDQAPGQTLSTTHATGIDGPTDVEAAEVRDTSILLRWAAPRAPVQGYRVSCTPTGGHGAPVTRTLARGQSEVTIDSLSPTTEYLIQVVAFGSAGESEVAGVTVQTSVDRPRGLTFREVGVDSMTASWRAPEGRVTGYRVTFQGAASEDGGFPREARPAPGPGDDSVTIGGLRPGQEYTVRVYALSGHRESVPLTGTQMTALPPPTALEFAEVGTDSVTVRWTEPRPDAALTGMRVVFEPRSRKASRKEVAAEGPRATGVTVTGLTAGVDYTVSVYSVKDELTSKPLVGTVRTVESVPAPSKVVVTETGAGSVTLEWRSRPDPLTSFLIVVRPAAGAEGRPAEHTAPPGARTYTLTGLQPGVRYVISIYAVRGSRRSQPITVTTATAVDSPTGLRRVASTESSLTLGWTRPRASITGYLLTCQAARGGPPREHRPDAGATQYAISDLQSNTEYVFSLVAVQETVRSQPLRGSFRTAEAARRQPVTSAPRPPVVKVPAGDRKLPSQRGDTSPLSSETRFNGNGPDLDAWIGQQRVNAGGARPGALVPSHPGLQLQVDGVALVAPAALNPEVQLQQHFTETEVTWIPRRQASEYLVSCIPVGGSADGSAPIQVRLPGSLSSTTLTGLLTGTQYTVVVEALQGSRRDKVLEEIITLLDTVPMNVTGDGTDDRCVDEDMGREYAVGEEWERPSDTGFMFLCRCLGHGSGHIRCDSSKWCHDNGQNYRIGEQWSTTTATGRRMSCTCLGNGLGQFKCEPDENTCYEGGKEYTVGQKWLRKNRGLDCTCTCHGGRRGYRCDCGAVQTVASGSAQGHNLHQIRNELLRRHFGSKCTYQC